jgi:4'-phosphopantetheinyl transferase
LAVWAIDLDSAPADLALLSPDERARAESFRFPVHQQRFVAGRCALRCKLGELTGQDPVRLEFAYAERGKPLLPGEPVGFNLAHSGSVALLAAAPYPVGIDLEHRRHVEFDLLAREVFSAAEWRRWSHLAPSDKARAFYRLWTRKEALLKGVGCGITENTRSTTVFFEDSDSIAAEGVPVQGWQVHSFELAAELPAAVAWKMPAQ